MIETNTDISNSIRPIIFSIVLAADTMARHRFSMATAHISQTQKSIVFFIAGISRSVIQGSRFRPFALASGAYFFLEVRTIPTRCKISCYD